MPLKLHTVDALLRADVLARERVLQACTKDSLAEAARKLAADTRLQHDILRGAAGKLVADVQRQQAVLAGTVGKLMRDVQQQRQLMDVATAFHDPMRKTLEIGVPRLLSEALSSPALRPMQSLLDVSSSIARDLRALQANTSLVTSVLQDVWRLNLVQALPQIDYAAQERCLCAEVLAAVQEGEPEVLEWFVTEPLGLPLGYCTAVWLALRAGHWEQARQPIRYVLKVARRIHAREEVDKHRSLFTQGLLSLDAPGSTGYPLGSTLPASRDPFAGIEVAYTLEQAANRAGLSADACLLATLRCQHGQAITRRDLPGLLRWPKQRVEAALREFQRKRPRLQHILRAWRGSH